MAQLMCLDMLEIRPLAMKSAWILDRRTLEDKNKALAKKFEEKLADLKNN